MRSAFAVVTGIVVVVVTGVATLCCLAGVFLLLGCGSPCQQIKATRCNAQVVELCGSNKKWQRVLSCSDVKPTSNPNAPKDWVCGETTTGHTCVPKGK